MKEDFNNWIASCEECARNKPPPKLPRAPLGSMGVGAPMDRLATDIIGPLPRTPRGNRYILIATDHFSKWVEIIPIPDQSAITCAEKLLNEVISRLGCPLSLHSDRGGSYENQIFTQLCEMLEIKKTRTTAKNPKCNGVSERFNKTLWRMLRAYLKGEQTDWDLHLGCLAAAYRATPHESTGLTPNLVMLGREVRLPAELMFGSIARETQETKTYGEYVQTLKDRIVHAHDIARKHLQVNAKRQKENYDVKLSVNTYKPGDPVLLLDEGRLEGICPKLQSLYKGPYLIVRKYNDLVYVIQTDKNGKLKVVNHNKLKPYKGQSVPKWNYRKFLK